MHVCMVVGEGEGMCTITHTHTHVQKRTDIQLQDIYIQYFQELSKFFKTK